MSEKIKIEKGIPIPRDGSGQSNKLYPLQEMEIGDSIVIKKSSLSAVSFAKLRTGRKFVSRKVDETHSRVWRTA